MSDKRTTKLQNYIRQSSGEVTHLQNVANRMGTTDNIKRLIAKRNKGQEAAQTRLASAAQKRVTAEAKEASYGADYNLAVQALKAKAQKNPVDVKALAARMQAAYAREDAKKKLSEDVSSVITDGDDRRKYTALRAMQSVRLDLAKKAKPITAGAHQRMAQQHGDDAEAILDKYRKESTDVCKVCGQTPCNCTSIDEGANVRAGNPKAYGNDLAASQTGFGKKPREDDEYHNEPKPKFKAKDLMDRPHTVHIDGKPWKSFNNGHQANAAANTLNARGKKAVAIANFKEVKESTEVNDKMHPDAIHVKPVKVNGQTKYHVHAVGSNFSHGIKKGEHLSDTELDDFAEMGGKIKHLKEQKLSDILNKVKV